MTEAEREELVENMKTALVNARLMGADYEHAARAALAVAEPVIREQCAQICERRYMGDNTREDMEAKSAPQPPLFGEKLKPRPLVQRLTKLLNLVAQRLYLVG
jgi:hypothetical protein